MNVLRYVAALCAILLFAEALVVGPPFANAQEAEPALADRIDAYLRDLVTAGFSGAVLVADDGEILLHEGYGLANDAARQPVAADTVFGFGSITKQFTAAAILHLEMQGLLSTDDPIGDYIAPAPDDKAAITIHQLLTHTSGLRSHVFADDFLAINRDDAVRRILEPDLLFAPGTDVLYSDDAYKLLAAIVAIVSGQSWQRYLETKLFRPAALEDTGFFGDAAWAEGRVAHGYNSGRDEGSPAAWPRPQWALIGAGGVMTTVGDMYRWYSALQDGSILSAAATEKLWRPHARIGGRASYGYGWIIVETDDQGTFVETAGAGSSHNAYFHSSVADGLVVIVASNRIDEPVLSRLGLVATDETFYAHQVGDALVANIAANDFTTLPPFAQPGPRPLRPTPLGVAAAGVVGVVALLGLGLRLRRRLTRR